GFGSGIAYVGIAGGQRQLPAHISGVGRIAFLHAKRNPSHKSGRQEAALITCGAGELIVQPQRICVSGGIDVAAQLGTGHNFQLSQRTLATDPLAQFRRDYGLRRIGHTSASCFSIVSVSSSERPNHSRKTSSVCSPRLGALRGGGKESEESEKGRRVVSMEPTRRSCIWAKTVAPS